MSASTAFCAFCAAMLIALAEETIFRLALLSWLADALGGTWSVLLTSVLFSALHTRLRFKIKSLPSYFDYFLFSIVLGIITLYTESLLPAFVLHTMRNYILRCMLISRAEYDALHRSER